MCVNLILLTFILQKNSSNKNPIGYCHFGDMILLLV